MNKTMGNLKKNNDTNCTKLKRIYAYLWIMFTLYMDYICRRKSVWGYSYNCFAQKCNNQIDIIKNKLYQPSKQMLGNDTLDVF